MNWFFFFVVVLNLMLGSAVGISVVDLVSSRDPHEMVITAGFALAIFTIDYHLGQTLASKYKGKSNSEKQ